MPEVALVDLWVHLASDLDTYVTAVLDGEVEDAGSDGERMVFGGGRLRNVSLAGDTEDFDITLDMVERDTVDTLRSWRKQTVMVRDPRGRVTWGVYRRLSVTEIPGVADDVANISFRLEQVDGSAEV